MSIDNLQGETTSSFIENMRRNLQGILATNTFKARAEEAAQLREQVFDSLNSSQYVSSQPEYDDFYDDTEDYAKYGKNLTKYEVGSQYDAVGMAMKQKEQQQKELGQSILGMNNLLRNAKESNKLKYDRAVRDKSFRGGFGLFNKADDQVIGQVKQNVDDISKLNAYKNAKTDDEKNALLEQYGITSESDINNFKTGILNGNQYKNYGAGYRLIGQNGTVDNNSAFNNMADRRLKRKLGGNGDHTKESKKQKQGAGVNAPVSTDNTGNPPAASDIKHTGQYQSPIYAMTSFSKGPFGRYSANFGFVDPNAPLSSNQTYQPGSMSRLEYKAYKNTGQTNLDDIVRRRVFGDTYIDTRDQDSYNKAWDEAHKEKKYDSEDVRLAARQKDYDDDYLRQNSYYEGAKNKVYRQIIDESKRNRNLGKRRISLAYNGGSEVNIFGKVGNVENKTPEKEKPETVTKENTDSIVEEKKEAKYGRYIPHYERTLRKAKFGDQIKNGIRGFVNDYQFRDNGEDGANLVNIGRLKHKDVSFGDKYNIAMNVNSVLAGLHNNQNDPDLESMTSADQVYMNDDTDRGNNLFDLGSTEAPDSKPNQYIPIQYGKYGKNFRNLRSKVNRMRRFVDGGIYDDLTQEEIDYILANGGEIKYL